MYPATSGLAFEPGSGKAKGVFPLYYLRGLEAQLVAVGGSALDCCLLQDKVGHLYLFFNSVFELYVSSHRQSQTTCLYKLQDTLGQVVFCQRVLCA